MFAGGALTQCLRAVGVYASNCSWTGNPLGTGIAIGGFVLVAVGVWAMFFRRPPGTGKTESSAPDEEGFYPLRNQVEGSSGLSSRMAFNCIPSFHPSCSMISGGGVTTYLY